MSDPKSNDCDDVEITPEMIEAGEAADVSNWGDRQDVDFGVSLASARIGDELLTKHVADPEFMRQENWAAELASRVYKAMVKQTVCEGRFAILSVPETPRAYRRLSPGFGPRPTHCSEIPGTVAP